MDQIATRICQIADDVLGLGPGTVTLASSPADIDEWDSLAMLNLMVAVEDEFGVTIAPDDFEEVADIAQIVQLVSGLTR